jgi:hypothetical protein
MDEEIRYTCKYTDEVLKEANGDKELIEDFFEASADYFDENPDHFTVKGEMKDKLNPNKTIVLMAHKVKDSLVAMTEKEMEKFIEHLKKCAEDEE